MAALRATAARCGIRLPAFCLMPDHLYVVCSGAPGGDVALWLSRFKSAASRRVGQALWQGSYWDRHARRSTGAITVVEYTLANPERRGLRSLWTDWPWNWSEWHAR